jgi:hypothetical protein
MRRTLGYGSASPRLHRRIIMTLTGLAHHPEWMGPAFAALTKSLDNDALVTLCAASKDLSSRSGSRAAMLCKDRRSLVFRDRMHRR